MPVNPPSGDYYHVKVGNRDYDDYKTSWISKDKGIKAIYGIWSDDDGKHSEVSSYLFNKEKWTVKEAKNWVKQHKSSITQHKLEEYLVQAELVDEEDISEEALSKAGIKKNKDLLYSTFKLCHANTNENQDEFEYNELEEHFDTARFKPIDWEHGDEIIGTIYDTEFVSDPEEEEDDIPYIRAYAVIYKYKFPQRANEMKERHKNNNLFYSMEVWFERAACSECGEEFENPADYCSHLRNRMETKATSRKLKGITFGGAGIVENPADKDAGSLSIAKKKGAEAFYDVIDEENILETDLNEVIKEDKEAEKQQKALFAFERAVQVLLESEDISSDEKKEKFQKLSSQLLTIFSLNNDNSGGYKTMPKYTFETDEELKTAINKSEDMISLKQEKENLEREKVDLEKAKQNLESEKSDLETKKQELQDEYDNYKQKIEKDKLVATRIAELKEDKSIEDEKITEKFKEVLAKLSDEEFKAYKDTIVAKDPNPEENPSGSVQAGSEEKFVFGEFLSKIPK